MAIFDQDRQLITSMVAIRIMQAESIVDLDLLNFLIDGPKSISREEYELSGTGSDSPPQSPAVSPAELSGNSASPAPKNDASSCSENEGQESDECKYADLNWITKIMKADLE
jgi:hypothetical protein